MKTLKDLFDLVLHETEQNKDKAVQYQFSIDTKYNWC